LADKRAHKFHESATFHFTDPPQSPARLERKNNSLLEPMLESILIGGAELLAVSLSSALCLFAHLKGRLRRSIALGIAALALTIGAAIASSGLLGFPLLGHTAVPFGVSLILAAGINGLVIFQSSKPATGC
jgi:hypothetical protein